MRTTKKLEIENLKLTIGELESDKFLLKEEIGKKETIIFELKFQMQCLLSTLGNINCLSDFKKK